jgi:hypothetical protein
MKSSNFSITFMYLKHNLQDHHLFSQKWTKTPAAISAGRGTGGLLSQKRYTTGWLHGKETLWKLTAGLGVHSGFLIQT